jgi:hypothetical protein
VVFDLSPVYAIVAVAVGIVLTITDAPAAGLSLAVGPQYDTTHVYIAPDMFILRQKSSTASVTLLSRPSAGPNPKRL